LQVADYLSSQDDKSPVPDYHAPHLSPSDTSTFLRKLQPFQLTKSEVIMLLNLRPEDTIVLDCIIEEFDYRHGETEQEELLAIIKDSLSVGGSNSTRSSADG